MTRGRPDSRFFAAAPTREQARRVWWEDLKRLTPAAWMDGSPRETELLLRTLWGAELWVIGLDRPQRIEGSPWDGCVIDEMADCRPGTWEAHLRPALADRQGWAWLIGVPDRDAPGQVDYKRLHDHAASGLDPQWAVYAWPSTDILPPAEVESLRGAMDEETFRQEIGGEFVLAGGLAFPAFSVAAHVSEWATYEPGLALAWSLDFNVNPMCSGVLQWPREAGRGARTSGGAVRVLHEFVLGDSSTDAACDAFLDWCAARGVDARGVGVYGDPTGHARDSTSGRSDWAIVRRRLAHLRPRLRVPRAPWPVKDTLNALRARLRSGTGETGLIVHPSCRRLIREMGELLWPGDLSEGHCVAWLRYVLAWGFPVTGPGGEEAGRVSV